MKKCIEINLTKKTIEMIENIRGNLVEFAVALLRAGRGLKFPGKSILENPKSRPASRRAWIEISMESLKTAYKPVALLRAGRGLKSGSK